LAVLKGVLGGIIDDNIGGGVGVCGSVSDRICAGRGIVGNHWGTIA
jgi:hypothetical protein